MRGRTFTADFAKAWQAADKVVYSSTLVATPTANTQLERHFDPKLVQDLKAAAETDLLVGGPNLAAQALAAGLVDELPTVRVAGRPRRAQPRAADRHFVGLELLDEHRFANGVVHLRYRVR